MEAAHSDAKAKLEAIMDVEGWGQVEVAAEFQVSIPRHCDGCSRPRAAPSMFLSQAIADALMRNEVPRIGEPELRQLREASTPDAANSNGESAPPASVETVTVDSAGYKAVSSVLLLLTMVTHLLQCVARLQSAASLAAHMLPELLRLFNSKAFRQVLHAGAMRPESAGLKAITAKHLALSSQSLGLVLALLPHLRAVLAAYVPEGQRRLLNELDGVRAQQH